MDFSGSTQGELAIPMHAANVSASPYAVGAGGTALQLVHHEHGGSNTNNGQPPRSLPSAATAEDTEMETETPPAPTPGGKKLQAPAAAGIGGAAKYRECLKNHAAAIGGNATDGCGEFMPSGEEGSLEALKCSACGCHRNFHRKEAEDEKEDPYAAAADGFHLAHRAARRLLAAPAMTHPQYKRAAAAGGLLVPAASDPYGVGVGAYAAARGLPAPPGHQVVQQHHQYVMPLSMMQTSESEEMDGGAGGAGAAGGGGSSSSSRKRFRTKFTAEQKARMLEFAERVGWRLQKLDDAMVQAFCAEIGVKRRVLKVWMHNNKHNLATTKRLEKAAEASPPPPQQQAAMAAAAAAAAMASPPLQMPAAGVMPPPPPPPPQHQQQQLAGPSCLRGGHVSPPPPLKLE